MGGAPRAVKTRPGHAQQGAVGNTLVLRDHRCLQNIGPHLSQEQNLPSFILA